MKTAVGYASLTPLLVGTPLMALTSPAKLGPCADSIPSAQGLCIPFLLSSFFQFCSPNGPSETSGKFD